MGAVSNAVFTFQPSEDFLLPFVSPPTDSRLQISRTGLNNESLRFPWAPELPLVGIHSWFQVCSLRARFAKGIPSWFLSAFSFLGCLPLHCLWWNVLLSNSETQDADDVSHMSVSLDQYSQSVVCSPPGVSEMLSGDPWVQNDFHNNTKIFACLFTVLTFAWMMQKAKVDEDPCTLAFRTVTPTCTRSHCIPHCPQVT